MSEKLRQVVICEVEADRNGQNAALIHVPYPGLIQTFIGLNKRWRAGDKVRVTVELMSRKKDRS